MTCKESLRESSVRWIGGRQSDKLELALVVCETARRPGEVEERGSTRVSYCEEKAWEEGV